MTTPVWGCPYHGLVEDGRLALPNGKSLRHPHSGTGTYDSTGSTVLVKHPAAVPVERSSEEAEDDAARGWQWWDRAIIGGDRLHGARLNGWIYIDPAGECWRVELSLLGLNNYLKLHRFGVLSGEPLAHTIPLDLPDFGQATPALELPSGVDNAVGVTFYHATPTGNLAAIQLSLEFSGAGLDTQNWSRRPVGWLEVSISGVAAEAKANVSVMFTRAQTIGPVTSSLAPVTREDWWLEGEDSSTKTLVSGTAAVGTRLLIMHGIQQGAEVRGYGGWVVGVYYTPEGDRKIWRLSERTVTNFQVPGLEHSGPNSFAPGVQVSGTWTLKQSINESHTVELRLDDSIVLSSVISVAENIETTYLLEEENVNRGYYYSTTKGQVVYAPGGTQTIDLAGDVRINEFPLRIDGRTGFTPAAASEVREVPYLLGRSVGNWWANGAPADIYHLVQRLANQVFGIAIASSEKTDWKSPVATPDGLNDVGVLSIDKPYKEGGGALYASWCPVTNRAARSLKPVCFV